MHATKSVQSKRWVGSFCNYMTPEKRLLLVDKKGSDTHGQTDALQQMKFVYLSTGVVICLFTSGSEFTQQKK
jgi:hypothetical protein